MPARILPITMRFIDLVIKLLKNREISLHIRSRLFPKGTPIKIVQNLRYLAPRIPHKLRKHINLRCLRRPMVMDAVDVETDDLVLRQFVPDSSVRSAERRV